MAAVGEVRQVPVVPLPGAVGLGELELLELFPQPAPARTHMRRALRSVIRIAVAILTGVIRKL